MTFNHRVGGGGRGGGGGGSGGGGFRESQITHALAEYTAAQLQDLVDELDNLLSTAAAAGLTVGFMLDIRVGTEDKHPDAQTLAKVQEILTKVSPTAKFETRYK